MTAPFYVAEDDGSFRATEATRGPWSPDHQHGGPPSALLARAIERHAPASLRVARLSVLFHRPVAIDAYRVDVETARAGRKVSVVRAALVARDGRAAASAEAVLIRRDEGAAVPATVAAEHERVPPPGSCAPYTFSFFGASVGYHTAMEGRLIRGTFGEGRMAMWLRMRGALVDGEAPSPLERVMAAADSGNGVSVALDLAKYTFVNPDLTVTLARAPASEWVALDAVTAFGDDGIGLSDTRLLDEGGPIGRGLQTLIVERRA